uniref:Uncharacterized protein n=1 Tax=Vespula pensylvanica TaxID=30213 RepID=A0A834NSA9_VESPE|nr:hypothetical protein H0235_011602 [Vespula pensylvanica]
MAECIENALSLGINLPLRKPSRNRKKKGKLLKTSRTKIFSGRKSRESLHSIRCGKLRYTEQLLLAGNARRRSFSHDGFEITSGTALGDDLPSSYPFTVLMSPSESQNSSDFSWRTSRLRRLTPHRRVPSRVLHNSQKAAGVAYGCARPKFLDVCRAKKQCAICGWVALGEP